VIVPARLLLEVEKPSVILLIRQQKDLSQMAVNIVLID
jgi:hypothetical protein